MAGYDPAVPILMAAGGAQYGAAANVIREIVANRNAGNPPESLTVDRLVGAGSTGAAVGLAAGVGLYGVERAVRRARAKPKAKAKAAAAPDPPSPRDRAPNPAGVPDRGSTGRHNPLGPHTESRTHAGAHWGNPGAWMDPTQPPVGDRPPPRRQSRISSPAVARRAGIRERG